MSVIDVIGVVLRCDVCGVVHDHSCIAPCRYSQLHEACEKGEGPYPDGVECVCGQNNAHMQQWRVVPDFWPEIFKIDGKRRRMPSFLHGDFCRECAVKMSRHIPRVADVWMLGIFIGRLEKTIRERRKENARRTENNWPASHHAGKCGEGRNAGVIGYRTSQCAAQDRQKYQRLALVGDEDCDVPQRGRADHREVRRPAIGQH